MQEHGCFSREAHLMSFWSCEDFLTWTYYAEPSSSKFVPPGHPHVRPVGLPMHRAEEINTFAS